MSLTVTYVASLTVEETLTGATVTDVPAAAGKVTHSGWNKSDKLTASTTPPATVTASVAQALTAGAATLDLTALPGTEATVSCSGLKVQKLRLQNPPTNANPITIAKGASNGWTPAGSAFSITLMPGQDILFGNNGVSVGTTVDGTHKTLDLTGTGTQVLNVQIVAG